jgi:hypothetical protein
MKKKAKKSLTASQIEVVTLAVFLAGGDQLAVDTEDVAIRAHEIAPGRFSWRKYPDRINLELVRVYLSDAKKIHKGGMLLGSGRTGWSLTPTGHAWIRKRSKALLNEELVRSREDSKAGSIDEQRWRRERLRILETAAWKRWQNKEIDITPFEASEVFRIDSYSNGAMTQKKIARLRALFDEDPQIGPFIAHLENAVKERNTWP